MCEDHDDDDDDNDEDCGLSWLIFEVVQCKSFPTVDGSRTTAVLVGPG
jgi:hypothetical protein